MENIGPSEINAIIIFRIRSTDKPNSIEFYKTNDKDDKLDIQIKTKDIHDDPERIKNVLIFLNI